MKLILTQEKWLPELLKLRPDLIDINLLAKNNSIYSKQLFYDNIGSVDINDLSKNIASGLLQNDSKWAYELLNKINPNFSLETLSDGENKFCYEDIKRLDKKDCDRVDWYNFSYINKYVYIDDISKSNKYYKLFDFYLFSKNI